MAITRNFNLFLNAGHSVPLVINANQYDQGESWVFTLFNSNGTQYVPSTGAIVGIKSDGLGIINSGSVVDGKVVITETQQMTAAPGKAVFELMIDNGTHGTANFIVLVEPKPGDNATLSESDLSLLQEAIDSTSPVVVAENVSEWLEDNITPTTPAVDASLTVSGAAADAKATGERIAAVESTGGGLTADIKEALLACFEKVAWIDANGQDYYDDLEAALYPPANLSYITAVYTQSGTVYTTDTLDSLKPDLVVTAHYSDSTTATVTDYVLSGTLAEGTSTITVTYGGKTTAFNVTVTEVPSYVTTGLIHNWDGINNTGNGDESHSSTTTTWADLVGSINLSGNFEKAVWASNGLTFSTPTVRAQSWGNSSLPSIDGECTIEMVVTINDVITAGLGTFGPSRSSAPNSSSPLRKICIYSDGTLSGQGQSGLTYSNPESSLLDVHSISCVYNTTPAVTSIKVNGQEASASSVTHSLAYGSNKTFIGMADGTSSLYGFNGTIHAIRIYNRVLTDEERLKNYNMDVSRFEFGV